MTKEKNIYPKLSQGTLTSAYGRDYSTKAEVIADFRAGKDFIVNFPKGSIYCSIRDGVIGEMIKFPYNKGKEAIFYTITASDFITQ